MATKKVGAKHKKKDYVILPCVEPTEKPYTLLSERKTKNFIDKFVDNSSHVSSFLYSGEARFSSLIKYAEKLIRKNRLLFDYDNGVFTFYVELFDKEYYRELKLVVEDDCYVLKNSEFSYQFYIAERKELQELIDYVFINYNSKYKNGLITLR